MSTKHLKVLLAVVGAILSGLAAGMIMSTQARAQAPGAHLDCTLLPSAARTSVLAVVSTDRVNAQWRGVHVVLNISAYTSGTFTPTIQAKDPISGNYYTILAGSGISSATSSILRVYPGLTAGTNIANDVLPRTWRVSVLGTATPSATYSVSCSLVE